MNEDDVVASVVTAEELQACEISEDVATELPALVEPFVEDAALLEVVLDVRSAEIPPPSPASDPPHPTQATPQSATTAPTLDRFMGPPRAVRIAPA